MRTIEVEGHLVWEKKLLEANFHHQIPSEMKSLEIFDEEVAATLQKKG